MICGQGEKSRKVKEVRNEGKVAGGLHLPLPQKHSTTQNLWLCTYLIAVALDGVGGGELDLIVLLMLPVTDGGVVRCSTREWGAMQETHVE
jgi:hypothetical protein